MKLWKICWIIPFQQSLCHQYLRVTSVSKFRIALEVLLNVVITERKKLMFGAELISALTKTDAVGKIWRCQFRLRKGSSPNHPVNSEHYYGNFAEEEGLTNTILLSQFIHNSPANEFFGTMWVPNIGFCVKLALFFFVNYWIF